MPSARSPLQYNFNGSTPNVLSIAMAAKDTSFPSWYWLVLFIVGRVGWVIGRALDEP